MYPKRSNIFRRVYKLACPFAPSRFVDWALGYMMKETNRIPAESSQPRMQLATFVVLILCFVAFFLLAIGFGIHAYKLRSVSPSYQRFSQYGAI